MFFGLQCVWEPGEHGVFSGFLFISLAASLPHTSAESVVFMHIYAYKIYVMKALILYFLNKV